MMDEESFRQVVEGESREKDDARKKTKTLWTRDKGGKEVTLDDFTILKVLGKGAFGKVLLVEKKESNGEWFAMKTIKKSDIIEKDQLEHTRTEKMILEHVNHPFLVNLAYAFQTPEKLFFIMQFMSMEYVYSLRGRRAVSAPSPGSEVRGEAGQVLRCGADSCSGPSAQQGHHLPRPEAREHSHG